MPTTKRMAEKPWAANKCVLEGFEDLDPKDEGMEAARKIIAKSLAVWEDMPMEALGRNKDGLIILRIPQLVEAIEKQSAE